MDNGQGLLKAARSSQAIRPKTRPDSISQYIVYLEQMAPGFGGANISNSHDIRGPGLRHRKSR